MAFMYYPTKFDLLLEEVVSNLNSQGFEKKLQLSTQPSLMDNEQGWTVDRDCDIVGSDREVDDNYFFSLFREVSQRGFYVGQNYNFKKGKNRKSNLSGTLLTKIVNNDELINCEGIYFPNEAADIVVSQRKDQFSFSLNGNLNIIHPDLTVISSDRSDLLVAADKPHPYNNNIEFVKDVLTEIFRNCFSYRLRTGKIV